MHTTLSPRQKITAVPYANSLRPGSSTTSVDAAGNTLTSVYIADYTYAGIDAYAYYTGTPGLYGSSNSSTGKGVYGNASAATGTNYGVYGRAASHDGFGVYGLKEGGSNLVCQPGAFRRVGGYKQWQWCGWHDQRRQHGWG